MEQVLIRKSIYKLWYLKKGLEISSQRVLRRLAALSFSFDKSISIEPFDTKILLAIKKKLAAIPREYYRIPMKAFYGVNLANTS